MSFITNTDFLSIIDQESFDDVSQNTQANIDLAVSTAIDEAWGYLNVRFDAEAIFNLTGTNRPAAVVKAILDLSLYQLHASISPDNIPELRTVRRNESIQWLEKVADGFVNPKLPVKADEPTTPLRYGNSNTKTNPYY
ncbi:MAG: DUF1320 domain-containing protein [Crocinitomicaceae bacterium]|jgi:hypothetical protein|nr:DUF1320 domain-containing protein [Crocinitomicaceae bacterium]